ncbi:MAG: alpha-L-fucosidase [Thermoguttaceae bacterium]
MVTTKKLQYPQEVSVLDFEKGRANALTPFPWLNDDTISTGSWCYTTDLEIKPAVQVLHDFIDAVSKNGQLLLNISPKSDGTIPQDQRDCLLAIGDWLKVNGEAIYGTRPWLEYGEGPNVLTKTGSFTGSVEYGDKDIRYTQSKDGGTVYAIALGWPQEKLRPTILRVGEAGAGQVELVGKPGKLTWRVENGRLSVDMPDRPAGQPAYAFKLSGFRLSLTPEAVRAKEESLKKVEADLKELGRTEGKTAKKKTPSRKS